MGATYQPPQWLIPDNANTDKVGNYCFDLDGTGDWIDINPTGVTMAGKTALSISVWIKPAQVFTTANERIFEEAKKMV